MFGTLTGSTIIVAKNDHQGAAHQPGKTNGERVKTMRHEYYFQTGKFILSAFVLFASAAIVSAQIAGGGTYRLEQSVIAGGGSASADAGNTFSLIGSIGQAITDTSSGSPYRIRSGFLTADPLSPTAAAVTVGGRITTFGGRGIRSVIITMTDVNGLSRTAVSTAFGYYSFTDVAAGTTYIVTAKGKNYEFSQPVRFLNINEDALDIDFTANPD